jgi:hypothetical protein
MTKKAKRPSSLDVHYDYILGDISNVIDAAKRSAARSVNCIMTAAYWLVGRRIVESEQKGEIRAEYGDELIERLAADLSARHGRGFSVRNVWQMKAFYLAWPIPQTVSAQSEGREILQTVSAESPFSSIASSSASLVGLCPAAFGEERKCQTFL